LGLPGLSSLLSLLGPPWLEVGGSLLPSPKGLVQAGRLRFEAKNSCGAVLLYCSVAVLLCCRAAVLRFIELLGLLEFIGFVGLLGLLGFIGLLEFIELLELLEF
jgi:hypothetical protein